MRLCESAHEGDVRRYPESGKAMLSGDNRYWHICDMARQSKSK
jgi:hypothetical protein